MKYAKQYLQTAITLITEYQGGIPLHYFLKKHFATGKKYGSKDRRHISHLCYAFFRMGHSFKSSAIKDRIVIALFLAGDVSWQNIMPEAWHEALSQSFNERINFIEHTLGNASITNIFPWYDAMDSDLDKQQFSLSHLIQPYLFIRVRPGREKQVHQKLEGAAIEFEEISPSCLSFKNQTQLEKVLQLNKEYVVQDYNSQRVGDLLSLVEKYDNENANMQVWDCCAASGGKSIMAHDALPGIHLSVSDVRRSIIYNLESRLHEAGINHYTSFVADLSKPITFANHKKFDLVICDAPCSGSGTWGRNPEQLFFFDTAEINRYSALQQTIVRHVVGHIKQGGYLLYITCSVFKKENEAIIDMVQNESGLQLVSQQLYAGYKLQADTMYAALLKVV